MVSRLDGAIRQGRVRERKTRKKEREKDREEERERAHSQNTRDIRRMKSW